MKSREQLIKEGKVWLVYPDSDGDAIQFEGKSRAACLKYLKLKGLTRDYKKGIIRIGELIWEKP